MKIAPRTRVSAALFAMAIAAANLPAPAAAGPAADQAKAHFAAIGSGQLNAILADYAADAVFYWVGGPLDGDYRGQAAIAQVWGKFTRALGPLRPQVGNLREGANPEGATITADVLFVGKKTIPVRYVLVYRGGKLVGEVWQIDPSLKK